MLINNFANPFETPEDIIKLIAIKEPRNSVFLLPSINEKTNPQINPSGKPLKNNARGLKSVGRTAKKKSANSENPIKPTMRANLFTGRNSAMNFIPQNLAHM